MKSSDEVVEQIRSWLIENSRWSDDSLNLLDSLMDETKTTLDSVVVRNPNGSHYGRCPNIMSAGRMYVLEIAGLSNDNWLPGSKHHIIDALRCHISERVLGGISIPFRWTSFMSNLLREFVVFPDTDQVRQTCRACDEPILIPEDYRFTNSYRAITAIHNGKEITVHENCSFTCSAGSGCGRSYATHVRIPNTAGTDWEFARIDPNESIIYFRGEQICGECFDNFSERTSQCGSCSHYFYTEEVTYDDHDDTDYCDSCYRDTWRECDECGREYSPGRGTHNCFRGIHYYSYKPVPIFHGKAPYYFGIELEVEQVDTDYSVESGVAIVENTLGKRAYLKEDGSLENGFEIVTHPHSLAEFQESVDWGFLTRLKGEGFRSWDTSSCGLHVHISRTAFADDNHLLRFMKFIYDNKGAVRTLAGRSSDYAKFSDSGRLVSKVKQGITSDGHMSAVNTENDETIEVRVFRGSLRKERVLSAVEFCHAAIEHTRDMKIVPKEKPLSWTKFLAYMVKTSVRYPNLNLIMESTLNNFRQPNQREREEDN